MNKDSETLGCSPGKLRNLLFIRLPLFFLASIILTACQPDEDFTPQSGDDPIVISEGAGEFQKMILDINELRAAGCKCGNTDMPPVGPVQWNDRLAKAAAEHNADMAQTGELNHTGSDGSNAGDRLARNGYNWRSYGENIASGFTSAESVLQAWIDSPGHCRNIMNASFEEIGVARQGNYWTQVFASPL